MRQIFLIFFFWACTNQLFSQGWQQLPHLPTISANSVYFTTANIGYIVCNGGIILKTVDGGYNWSSQSSGIPYDLYSVEFTDENVGYIVGWGGYILKTIDGGTNWIVKHYAGPPLVSICFPTSNIGYACGYMALILKTNDSGETWTGEYGDSNVPVLNSINFPDTNTGYVVGYNSLILKKENGGNWTVLPNYPGEPGEGFSSVFFLNPDTGIICGSHKYKTNDGGGTWSRKDSLGGSSIFFYNSSTIGYVVGDGGLIQKTFDCGETWFFQNSGVPNDLISVHFPTLDTGYIVGWGGVLLKTTTGGVGINENFSPHNIKIYPNPASNNITIDIPEIPEFSSYSMIIYNILGEKQIEKVIRNNNKNVSITILSQGSYVIKIITPTFIYNKILIVDKLNRFK